MDEFIGSHGIRCIEEMKDKLKNIVQLFFCRMKLEVDVGTEKPAEEKQVIIVPMEAPNCQALETQ